MDEPLLRVENLRVSFESRSLGGRRLGTVRAVDGVDLTLAPGEVLGLVGESGCGKTTLGRTVVGLAKPTEGSVTFTSARQGKVLQMGSREYRRLAQIIFQDPYSSLNPRRRIGDILMETRLIQGFRDRQQNRDRIVELLAIMGFGPETLQRYPYQFSGGQLQRIGIARAIVNEPELVVCDEPVSALDVSIQAQILNLLADLQRDQGYAYLFITHDLSVVRYIADRVLVMYLGEIVEELAPRDLIEAPLHPYTRMLSGAIPGGPAREQIVVRGEIPSPLQLPTGCRFHTRCPLAMPICSTETPVLTHTGDGHRVRCHLFPPASPGELDAGRPASADRNPSGRSES
ncbi:MAG: ABC transporter ATP-binding protein [Propionicimonas sp.]